MLKSLKLLFFRGQIHGKSSLSRGSYTENNHFPSIFPYKGSALFFARFLRLQCINCTMQVYISVHHIVIIYITSLCHHILLKKVSFQVTAPGKYFPGVFTRKVTMFFLRSYFPRKVNQFSRKSLIKGYIKTISQGESMFQVLSIYEKRVKKSRATVPLRKSTLANSLRKLGPLNP